MAMPTDRPSAHGGTLSVLALVAALFVGLAVLPRLMPPRQGPLVGRDAPDFQLAMVANGAVEGTDGATLRMGELRGRAVLLDFWATWCGPCRAEAPIVDRVARRWQGRGVVVVGVNTDSREQGDPLTFAAAHRLSYPIVRDESGDMARAYDVEGLPTLVMVSRTGKVIAVRTGLTDDGEIERLIRQAL